MQHISTAGAVELVSRAKKDGKTVTTEVAPHHLLLTDEACATYDTNTKMNPPLRTAKDVAACIQGVIDSTIDCAWPPTMPRTRRKKKNWNSTKPPSVSSAWKPRLALYVKALVEPGHLTWMQLIDKMSTTPAKLMRITGKRHTGYRRRVCRCHRDRSQK